MAVENQLPHVDVIILSWNRTQVTLEAIEDALDQQGVIPHVYVVDQGSGEESLTALRQMAADGRITLREMGHNVGSAEGRNIAMRMGDSPYIFGMDNDAVLEHRHTLAYAVERFRQDPQLGLLAFRVRNHFTDEDDMHSMATYPRSQWDQFDEEFLTVRYVACGHMLRRDIVERGRGYDARIFFYCEEQDMSYRVISQGYHVLYDPCAVVRHKTSPEGRFYWKGNLYYYLTRNTIFLDYKYFQSPWKTLVYCGGYILRGLLNRVGGQGVRGVWDALRMIRRLPREDLVPLSEEAKRYIWEHDTRHRGSMLQRARRDLIKSLVPAHNEEKTSQAAHGGS